MKTSKANVPSTVNRLTKQVGADTTQKNAIRDGAQFAWVPTGDTCAFCIALASRGWQYASKKAIKGGHAEHIHAHCDCQYSVRFDNKSTVAGYDPNKYLKMYESTNGKTSKEKINSLRRIIAEQKRQIKTFSDDVLKRNRYSLITAEKVENSKYEIYVSKKASHKVQNLENIEKEITSSLEQLNIKDNLGNAKIIILPQKEMGNNTLASYNAVTNEFYLSDILGNKTKTIELQSKMGFASSKHSNSTIKHEIIHWQDAEGYKKNKKIKSTEDYNEYLKNLRQDCKIELDKLGITADNVGQISEYANVSFYLGEFDEVLTEYRVLR